MNLTTTPFSMLISAHFDGLFLLFLLQNYLYRVIKFRTHLLKNRHGTNFVLFEAMVFINILFVDMLI